jgi:hypothetical protein
MHIWRLLVIVLTWALPGISQAAAIGWPEAVSQLAEERSKAERCVGSFRAYGNKEQIARGRLAYGTAQADFDGVIAGLITALAEGETPESLPSLETKLARVEAGLREFCKTAADLVSSASEQKGILDAMVKAAVEPVIKALSDAVAALYNNHRKDDALTRQTIQTQLEAAKWPDFGAAAQ